MANQTDLKYTRLYTEEKRLRNLEAAGASTEEIVEAQKSVISLQLAAREFAIDMIRERLL